MSLAKRIRTPYEFFYKYAKSLVSQLSEKERTCGYEWLAYLQANKDEPWAVNVIQVFIMVLTRENLIWPFYEAPEKTSKVFDKELSVLDMARLVLKVNHGKEKTKNQKPTIFSSISSDLKEYTAVQEIPRFGLQCYYALADEPISNWSIPKSESLPSAEQMKLLSWEKCMDMLSQCNNSNEDDPHVDRNCNKLNQSTIRKTLAAKTFRWADKSKLSLNPEKVEPLQLNTGDEIASLHKLEQNESVEFSFGDKLYFRDYKTNISPASMRAMQEGPTKKKSGLASDKLKCKGNLYDFVGGKIVDVDCQRGYPPCSLPDIQASECPSCNPYQYRSEVDLDLEPLEDEFCKYDSSDEYEGDEYCEDDEYLEEEEEEEECCPYDI